MIKGRGYANSSLLEMVEIYGVSYVLVLFLEFPKKKRSAEVPQNFLK